MSRPVPCPHCGGPAVGHGVRHVDDPVVAQAGLRWERTALRRSLCRACGRTSDAGEEAVDARRCLARRYLVRVAAAGGLAAAARCSGLCERTAARWVEAGLDAMLCGELPARIRLSGARGLGTVALSDAATGGVLDLLPLDPGTMAEALRRRGGCVEVAWVSPDARLREAVEASHPGSSVRVAPDEGLPRLRAVAAAVAGTPFAAEAGLALDGVSRRGWDVRALDGLRAACRGARLARHEAFLDLWGDAVLAGVRDAVAPPPPLPPSGLPLAVARARLATGLDVASPSAS